MIQKKRINNDVFVRWGVFTPEGLPVDLTEVTSITIEARPQSSNGRYPMVSEVVDNFVEAYFLAKDQKVVGKYNLYLTYTIDDPNIIGGVATYTIDYCDAFELLPKSCFVDGEDDVDPVNIQGIIASFTYSMLTEEEKNDLASRLSGNSGAQNLSDLLDVTISNLEIDQILKYDGTKWVNATPTGGSSSNVSWGIPTSQYTPLTVNGATRNLSLNNHTHHWDTITNRPLTDEQFQDLLEIADLWKLDNDGNLYTERNVYSHGWISEYNWGESPTPPVGVYNLKDLLDVGIINPQEDNILRFNGSHWVNVPSSNVGTLVEWSSETDNYVNLLVGDSSKSISLHGHKHEIEDINNLQDSLDFKQDSIPLGDISQYYRGDKEWATLNTDTVVEATNLYYTPERVIELTGDLYAKKDHTHAFNSLTGLPNTLDGYGIIDAYSKSEIDNLIPSTSGFWVKSVGLEAPTGFTVSNSPIIYEGNIKLSFASGYSLPSNSKQYNWDLAFSDRHTHTNINVLNELNINDVNNWNSIQEHLNDYSNPHQVSFRQLNNKPTTLLGYGITDAYNKTEVDYIFNNIPNKEVLGNITQEMLDNASREMLGIDSSREATDKNFFSALRVLAEILRNNETLKNLFLSKLEADIAKGKITFEQGLDSQALTKLVDTMFGDFQSGMHTGQGGAIDSAGNAELESLVLRSFLEVPSIRYNELEYIGEEIIIGAGAVVKDVEHLGDDSYRLTLKLEEGQFNPFQPSDLLKGIYNMDEDGNFTGFGTTYVSVSSIDEHEMIVILADESDVVGNSNMPPRKFMHLARIGNFIDEDRQSYISLSAKDRAITQYGGVNAFAKKNNQGDNVRAGVVTTQWGRAEGLEFIENFENLPITKDSDVLYTDTLLYNKQIKVDYEGIVIKEYIDRGQWFEGMECQVTETTIDEVWIEAEKFRLIDRPIENDPFVTTEKPTRESEDWMLILSLKEEIDAAVIKATYWSIKASAPVIYKDANSATASGVHTPVTVTGELRSGTTTTQGGFISIQPNGGAETSATASPRTIAPTDTEGKTSYTVRLYETASKSTLLDTQTIPVVFKGASGINAINVSLSNEANVLPASSEGVVSNYTGSGTVIRVFEGATELTYGTGNGQYQVSASGSGINVGTSSTVGNTRVYGEASSMTSDNATIIFTISGKTSSGASFNLTKVQTFAKSRVGQKGEDAVAPIIIDGFWAFWDKETETFIPSEFLAIGDDGHAPIIRDDYWYEWNPALEGEDKYQNTGVRAVGVKGDGAIEKFKSSATQPPTPTDDADDWDDEPIAFQHTTLEPVGNNLYDRNYLIQRGWTNYSSWVSKDLTSEGENLINPSLLKPNKQYILKGRIGGSPAGSFLDINYTTGSKKTIMMFPGTIFNETTDKDRSVASIVVRQFEVLVFDEVTLFELGMGDVKNLPIWITRKTIRDGVESAWSTPVKWTGEDGEKGKDGTGINVVGSASTWNTLPTSGNNLNDARIVQDTGVLAVWDGTKWVAAGEIKGPAGDTPYIGGNGNWWIGGTDTGIKATGPKGDKGDKGDDGTSVRIVGKVDTKANLPETWSVLGDGYITEDTGHLHVWDGSGNWLDVGKIQGDTSYFHVKYSDDGGETFTTNNGEDLGSWMGTYVDFIEEDSDDPTDYKWIRVEGVKGDDGANYLPMGEWDSETEYEKTLMGIPLVKVYAGGDYQVYTLHLKEGVSKNVKPWESFSGENRHWDLADTTSGLTYMERAYAERLQAQIIDTVLLNADTVQAELITAEKIEALDITARKLKTPSTIVTTTNFQSQLIQANSVIIQDPGSTPITYDWNTVYLPTGEQYDGLKAQIYAPTGTYKRIRIKTSDGGLLFINNTEVAIGKIELAFFTRATIHLTAMWNPTRSVLDWIITYYQVYRVSNDIQTNLKRLPVILWSGDILFSGTIPKSGELPTDSLGVLTTINSNWLRGFTCTKYSGGNMYSIKINTPFHYGASSSVTSRQTITSGDIEVSINPSNTSPINTYTSVRGQYNYTEIGVWFSDPSTPSTYIEQDFAITVRANRPIVQDEYLTATLD